MSARLEMDYYQKGAIAHVKQYLALPNQQFVGKPYKILHNSMNSLTTAVSKIKKQKNCILWKAAFSWNPRESIITRSSAMFVIRVLTAQLLILSLQKIAQI